MRLAVLIHKNSQAYFDDEKMQAIGWAILQPGTYDILTFEEAQNDNTYDWAIETINNVGLNVGDFSEDEDGIFAFVFDVIGYKDYWGEYDEDYNGVACFRVDKPFGEWWKAPA